MKALVVGASGAIGRALVTRLVADDRFDTVHALARQPLDHGSAKVLAGTIDLADPASITAAFAAIAVPIDLTIIATGLLHAGPKGPERALRELEAEWLAKSFAVNTIGPALVLQQVAPLLPRKERGVIAALSARVGSVSDNRVGGWYGYRAAKAALNMVIRCAAIEIARSRPGAVCVGLHPGTVDSGLSRPFQANVPAGKLFTPEYAAERLLAVLDGLGPDDSGRCFAWDGREIVP